MKSERWLSNVIHVRHDLIAGMLEGVHKVAVGWQTVQAPAQPARMPHNSRRQTTAHLSDCLHHPEHAGLTGEEVLLKVRNRLGKTLACRSL